MPVLRQCNEAELIDCIKAGASQSRDAAAILFARYRGRAMNLAGRWGGGDDVVQDACLAAWRSFDSYDPAKGRFGAWFYAIMRNCFIERCRESGREPKLESLDYTAAAGAKGAGPFTELAGWEFWLLLRKELDLLPERQREAVYMRVIENYTYREIAEEQDVKYRAAHKNVQEGLKKLHGRLESQPEVVDLMDSLSARKRRQVIA